MIKGSSLFSQLLHHFPRPEFAHLVAKHQAERRSKGFSCWTQLISMLFCHMAHADSLREICGGLACCIGKLKHQGISKPPNKSTLSYANQNRPTALFEELFWTMLHRFRTSSGLGLRKRKADLKINSSVWIQRRFHSAPVFFPGPSIAEPKAELRFMCY